MKILLLVFSVQIIYLPDILMERLKSLPYLDFVFVVNLLIHNLILYSVFKVQFLASPDKFLISLIFFI